MSDRMAMMWGLALAAVSRDDETVGELMSGIWRDTDAVELIADRYAAALAEGGAWRDVVREALWAVGVGLGEGTTAREAMALILAGIGEMRAVPPTAPVEAPVEARKPRGKWDWSALWAQGKIVAWAYPSGVWEVYRRGEIRPFRSDVAPSQEAARLAVEDALDAAGIPYDLADGGEG